MTGLCVCTPLGSPARLRAFSCLGHWHTFLPSVPSLAPLSTEPKARPVQADHSMLWLLHWSTCLELRLWWPPARPWLLLLLVVACSHLVSQSCHIHFLVCVGELFTLLATGWHLWFYFKSFFFFLIMVLCRWCEFMSVTGTSCRKTPFYSSLPIFWILWSISLSSMFLEHCGGIQ